MAFRIVVGFWVFVFAALMVIAMLVLADHNQRVSHIQATADQVNAQAQLLADEQGQAATEPESLERPTHSYTPNGVTYSTIPADPAAAPEVEIIEMPDVPGGSAIWGALGRDAAGRIWFAVSMRARGSAHLFNYDPATGQVESAGDVVTSMLGAAQYDSGVSQIKIHSRLVFAPDEFLYFTSMDEQGEDLQKEVNPKWGAHLWRLRLEDNSWKHIAATPEALIAVSCTGRYVYALGYFGHILYQYDSQSVLAARLRSDPVGSVGGHISRNFFSDHRDHVYVPRLRPGDEIDQPPVVTLVEYDPKLNEIAESPLDHYLGRGEPADSHGIVAFQHMLDHSIIFATHEGMLYRVTAQATEQPAVLEQLGYFHPDGRRYVSSMFTYAGTDYVVGVAKNPRGKFEWLCFDLNTRQATAAQLNIQYDDERMAWKHLLYGSITRDNDGNFYVAGTDQARGKPVLLKLVPR